MGYDPDIEKMLIEATDKYFMPKEYIDILRSKKALSGERGTLTMEKIILFATGYYNIDFSKPDGIKFWLLKLLYDYADDGIVKRKLQKIKGTEQKIRAIAHLFVDTVAKNIAKDKQFRETFQSVYKSTITRIPNVPIKQYSKQHSVKNVFVYDLKGDFVASYHTKMELLGWLGESRKSFERLNKCIKQGYPFNGYAITEEERK